MRVLTAATDPPSSKPGCPFERFQPLGQRAAGRLRRGLGSRTTKRRRRVGPRFIATDADHHRAQHLADISVHSVDQPLSGLRACCISCFRAPPRPRLSRLLPRDRFRTQAAGQARCRAASGSGTAKSFPQPQVIRHWGPTPILSAIEREWRVTRSILSGARRVKNRSPSRRNRAHHARHRHPAADGRRGLAKVALFRHHADRTRAHHGAACRGEGRLLSRRWILCARCRRPEFPPRDDGGRDHALRSTMSRGIHPRRRRGAGAAAGSHAFASAAGE